MRSLILLVALAWLSVPACVAAPLTDIDRTIAENDCAKLSVLYAEGIDEPNADLFASVFAHDAVWDVGGGRFVGRDAIAAYIGKRPVSHGKHVITNILVDVIDDSHARGSAYLIDYHWDTAHPEAVKSLSPDLVGKFTDTYVREDGKWVFQSRALDRVTTYH